MFGPTSTPWAPSAAKRLDERGHACASNSGGHEDRDLAASRSALARGRSCSARARRQRLGRQADGAGSLRDRRRPGRSGSAERRPPRTARSPGPSRRAAASVPSICARWATIRSRTSAVVTLPSSKRSALIEVLLLRLGLAPEEHPRLAVVVEEALRRARAPSRRRSAAGTSRSRRPPTGPARARCRQASWAGSSTATGVDALAHEPVALVVGHRRRSAG